MGKGRMSLLDVRAMVKELRAKILSLRAGNIYHLNQRTYILKMQGGGRKVMLIMESGIRIHTTKFVRQKDSMPNSFATKLRKHIKSVRLESINQVGVDRVIDLQFGVGDRAHHVILELYAKGNIILTDKDYKILVLLRSHDLGESHVTVGKTYVFSSKSQSLESLQKATTAQLARIFAHALDPSLRPQREPEPDAKAEEEVKVVKRNPKLLEKLKALEIQLQRTQKNKATNAHLCSVRSRVAKIRKELGLPPKSSLSFDSNAISSNSSPAEKETKKGTSGDNLRENEDGKGRKAKKGKKRGGGAPNLWNILCTALPYGPQVVSHCLMSAGLRPASITAAKLGWNRGRSHDDSDVGSSGAAGAKGEDAGAGDSEGAEERDNEESHVGRFDRKRLEELAEALGPAASFLMRVSTEMPLKAYVIEKLSRAKPAVKEDKAHGRAKKKMSKAERKALWKAKAKAEKEADERRKKGWTDDVGDGGGGDGGAGRGGRGGGSAESAGAPGGSSAAVAADSKGAENGGGAPAGAGGRRGGEDAKGPQEDAAAPAEAKSGPGSESAGAGSGVYSEFVPTRLAMHDDYSPKTMRFIEFESLDDAMDEFYSKVEMQKEVAKVEREKANAWAKVERVKRDHENRLKELEQQGATNVFKAELLSQNAELANAARNAVLRALAQGMDWKEIGDLVAREREMDNPVALAIKRLKLDQNMITLALSEAGDLEEEEEEDSDEDGKRKDKRKKKMSYDVDLDLETSVQQSINAYYKKKKTLIQKRERTSQASAKAIKQAERKTRQTLKVVDMKKVIKEQRKIHWWEKFHWFISSENFLVLSGNDAQQNEQLVKRYLGKNDLYMHAEVHGASSVIIKNPTSRPVTPKTLVQAATMTICYSSAWKNKVPVNAYWVYAHQVSKQAPSGEYLPTGSFMVRGKRNFVLHAPMNMAFALMFRVDKQSERHHVGERRPMHIEDELERNPARNDDGAGGRQHSGLGTGAAPLDSNGEETKAAAKDTATEEGQKEAEASATAQPLPADSQAPSEFDLGGDDDDEKDNVDLTTQFLSSLNNPGDEGKSGAHGDAGADGNGEQDPKGRSGARRGKDKGKAQAQSEQPKQKQKQKQQRLPRGKRSKMKRTKKKYADQDEEDLEIATQLLGLQKPKPRIQEEEVGANEDVKAGDEGGEKEVKRPGTEQGAKSRKKGKSQHRDSMRKDAGEEEDVEKQEVGHDELDCLTGKPLAMLPQKSGKDSEDAVRDNGDKDDDEEEHAYRVLYCVPVCAPLAAVSDYKFKAKVVPGKMKKGKAVKAALEMFFRQPNCTQLERSIIKAADENKLYAAMMSNSKVMAVAGGGGHKKGGKGRRRGKR